MAAHWKFDINSTDVSTENELWFDANLPSGGHELAVRSDKVLNDNWMLDTRAKSIVIHDDPASMRIACCDLSASLAVIIARLH